MADYWRSLLSHGVGWRRVLFLRISIVCIVYNERFYFRNDKTIEYFPPEVYSGVCVLWLQGGKVDEN